MSDNSLVVAALKDLTDQELLAIIRAVSEGRPGLEAIQAAAVAVGPSPPGRPGLPGIPQPPTIPQSPAVPPTPEVAGSPVVPPPEQIGAGTAQFVPAPDYAAGGVPTVERMRDKAREQWSAREEAGHRKLDEIRKSMHPTGADDQDDPKGNE